MTELILKIEDDNLLPILKKVIKAFPGIKVRTSQKKDPTLMTKKEFFDKVDASKKAWEEGHYTTINNADELNQWLNKL